ncbi:amidase [Silvibacterium dinghuense]|uniref:Amidase n=1 Tax=Silvibacterium dinghuense TaxID=1560006 RepID=A0A4Q1SH95_9BACT|nr:amidase [Silvibacterium dinghuense]RXS96938.1 amidase [Silvibacterium dinghuense]GGG94851.1 amidohydrolase [Silvibacterium dinghuense]
MPSACSPIASLLHSFLTREADPEQVLRAALARANGNASANTYLVRDEQWSLDQLKAPSSRSERGALQGLPVALKDCFDLEGFVTSSGSRFYAEHHSPAAADSWVAAQLKRAGAIVTGKTHLHQLAYGITGENRDYGDCLQPGAPELLTGGSSSGSAASVLEGSAFAAIGTDTGGSVRAPAALCGLAGYRASLGVGNWQGGAHLAQSFDTIGWLCRDLRDLPLLASALFGLDIPEASPAASVRVGIVTGALLEDCNPSILTAQSRWIERIQSLGVHVAACEASFWTEAYDIYAPIQAHEAAAIYKGHYEDPQADVFETAIAERLRWGAALSMQDVRNFRQRHAAFQQRMAALFTQFDFLLLPALPITRLVAGEDQTPNRPRILRYTTPASLGGNPTVVLPAAPAGLQLLAPLGDDARLLAFTRLLGEALRTES